MAEVSCQIFSAHSERCLEILVHIRNLLGNYKGLSTAKSPFTPRQSSREKPSDAYLFLKIPNPAINAGNLTAHPELTWNVEVLLTSSVPQLCETRRKWCKSNQLGLRSMTTRNICKGITTHKTLPWSKTNFPGIYLQLYPQPFIGWNISPGRTVSKPNRGT